MKKSGKKMRLLTLVLAICAVLTIAVAGVIAASATETPEAKWGTDAGNLTNSGTFAEALASGAPYVQLQGDVEWTETIKVKDGMILDLSKVETGTYTVSNMDENRKYLYIGVDVIIPENYQATADRKFVTTIEYWGWDAQIAPHEHNFSNFDWAGTTHTPKCSCGALGEPEEHTLVEKNGFHECTVCGANPQKEESLADYFKCKDANNDHICDIGGEVRSECGDNDNNHFCDVCGKRTSEHAYNSGSHKCYICGEDTACADVDPIDDRCDTCYIWMPFDPENRVPYKVVEIGEAESVITCTIYRGDESGEWFELVISGSGEVPRAVLSNEKITNAVSKYDIKSVVISEGITSIADEAFKDESQLYLYNVVIANSVTSIGDKAFYGCAIETLVPGSGIKTIGAEAFAYNDELTEIVLPEGLESIGEGAFSNTALVSVNIPASLVSIGDKAFGGVYALTAYTVADGNTAYSAIDGVLFNADATELISFPTGRVAETYTIPASVRVVKANAFANCDGLHELVISASVESVEGNACVGAEINVYVFEGAVCLSERHATTRYGGVLAGSLPARRGAPSRSLLPIMSG